MALHPHAVATGARITSSRRWAQFPIAVTGTLTKVRYETDTPVAVGGRMNLKKNDVSIYATTPDMPLFDDGDSFVTQSLNIAVNEGDIILLEVLISDSFVVIGPKLYGTLYIEDGLPTYFGGTSATSFSIGTGSKTFTTQRGLAYTVGSRMRIASSAGPTADYMEGIVTAYSGTTLTLTIDLAIGSGTHIDWLFSIAGARGATGATGSPGSTGPSGVVESIVPGTNITVDNTDPANPIVSSTGGGGGSYDYTIEHDGDFSGGTLDAAFTAAGTGVSYSGGLLLLAGSPNDGGGGTYPRIDLTSTQSFVDRCFIVKVAEKPAFGASPSIEFNMNLAGNTHKLYWVPGTPPTLKYDVGGANVDPNEPTFETHKHWLRIRTASKGTGSNTHNIYYEFSRDGFVWETRASKQITATNIDNIAARIFFASFDGSAPGTVKLERIIIGTMNY